MKTRIQVTVPLRAHQFPTRCARCFSGGVLISRKIGFDKRMAKETSSENAEYMLPEVPFCQRCAAWQTRIVVSGGVLAGAGLFGGVVIGIWLDLGRWLSSVLSMILLAPGLFLTNYRDRTVQISAFTSDTLTFSFKRADYADQFMEINKTHHADPGQLPSA